MTETLILTPQMMAVLSLLVMSNVGAAMQCTDHGPGWLSRERLPESGGYNDRGLFGGDGGSMYKTRRGAEKYLFNATVGLAIAFFIFTILTFLAVG